MIPPRFLRKILSGGDVVQQDRARAVELVDRRALSVETDADVVRFQAESARARAAAHVGLGVTPDGPYPLALPELLRSHALVTGSSGSGKTFLVTAILGEVLAHMARGAQVAVIVFDMKGEATDLLLRLAARFAERDPSFARDRLQVLRVFHGRHLVPWQLLAQDPSVAPAAQASAIAETIEATVRVATGIRQTSALSAVLLLAIERGWSLLELRYLIHAPEILSRAAESSRFPHLRTYFRDRFQREGAVTIDGLSARFDVLLGADELRAMFGAESTAPLQDAFRPGRLTVIDASGAPLGSRELSRAMGALFFERLSWCVFDPNRPLTADVLLVGDEIQEAATERVLGAIERIETLGRSFRTHLWTVHQTTEQLPRELLNILSTNVSVRIAGRASQRDLSELSEWLPATGTVARSREIWEAPARGPQFLSPAEEQRAAGERLRGLPRQHFLISDRRRSFAARFVRASDLTVPAWSGFPPALREAVERGAWGVPRETLLDHAREVEERAAAMSASSSPPATNARQPVGRGRSRGRVAEDLPQDLPAWGRRGSGRGGVP